MSLDTVVFTTIAALFGAYRFIDATYFFSVLVSIFDAQTFMFIFFLLS